MVLRTIIIFLILKLCVSQVAFNFYPVYKETKKDNQKHAFDSSAKVMGPNGLPKYKSGSNTEAVNTVLAQLKVGIVNEDASLPFRHLVTKYGYNYEKYDIYTNDGYVLSLFRIPGTGTPVFLMHGLLGSADDFIIAGPSSGLAYLLSAEGYDVWLGNARGNKHSKRHIFMDSSDPLFWDFSWHEIGIYDVPAMIDFVLDKTYQKDLKYIGHSQGTTVFFVMVSEKPEYNGKISMMVAMAPVAFLTKAFSPVIRLLAPGTSILQTVSRGMPIYEFQSDGMLANVLKQMVCGSGTLAEVLCGNPIFLLSGFDYVQLNVTNLPVIFTHLPAGSSIRQFLHYGQNMLSNDFRQFDHGIEGNLRSYGKDVPPRYNLSNIKVPTTLICGPSDWMSSVEDVELLRSKLKKVVEVYRVPYETFNHIDFIIAKDVKPLVHMKIITSLAMATL